MSEKNSELDAINHLLEIERAAAVLIDDAKVEAEKRISDAKSQYSLQYKAGYEKIVSELDSEYKSSVDDVSKKHEKEINAYKTHLEGQEQNKAAFSALLDKLLFE